MASQAAKHFGKFRKDEPKDNETTGNFADTFDLSSLDLIVNASQHDLEIVTADTGKQVLIQLGIEHEKNLVNQVNEDALDYARERSAEMVGKKWVDGELVDNPSAEWVISDATRDEIRSLVAKVESGELKLTDLTRAIMDAGAFSRERAELIARTEILTANAQGALNGFKSAESIGVKIKKLWQADDEACDICLENEAMGPIDLDAIFYGGVLAPVQHPRCECVLVPIVEDNE